MVAKVSSTQDNESGPQKTSIIVRQQVTGNPASVVLKSIPNKPLATPSTSSRSVVLNNGQVLGMSSILFVVFCSLEENIVIIIIE